MFRAYSPLSMEYPCPHWPVSVAPHAHTMPALSMTRQCASPAATSSNFNSYSPKSRYEIRSPLECLAARGLLPTLKLAVGCGSTNLVMSAWSSVRMKMRLVCLFNLAWPWGGVRGGVLRRDCAPILGGVGGLCDGRTEREAGDTGTEGAIEPYDPSWEGAVCVCVPGWSMARWTSGPMGSPCVVKKRSLSGRLRHLMSPGKPP
mmetsp:Transcript_22767/g.65132  ORF Transcript_22767/g.65132 Transcript_22767/m.65132 type:complete len:203 (-) Transcript_22767:451-1059(-)